MWHFWGSSQDEYDLITEDIRKSQDEFLERRVRRPYYSGMTTNGINYIDTRPIDGNFGTIDTFHTYNPSIEAMKANGSKPLESLPPHVATQEELSNMFDSTYHPNQNVTIVLAHGFSQGLGMWSESLDFFSALPNVNVNRVVAFDWAGMGGSKRDLSTIPTRSALTFFENYVYHDVAKQLKAKEKGNCKCRESIQQTLRNKLGLDPSQLPPVSEHSSISGDKLAHSTNQLRQQLSQIPASAQNIASAHQKLLSELQGLDMKQIQGVSEEEQTQLNDFVSVVISSSLQQDSEDTTHAQQDGVVNQYLSALPAHLQPTAESLRTSISAVLTPLMSDAKHSQTILEQKIIQPTTKLLMNLAGSLDNVLNFDKVVQNQIDKSYSPVQAVDYFIDPMIPMFKELSLDEQPVILVAHSLGGLLSAHFVHKYPGLVHSLILASPVGVCDSLGLVNDASPELIETLLSSSAGLDELQQQQQQQQQQLQQQQQQQQQQTLTAQSAKTPTSTQPSTTSSTDIQLTRSFFIDLISALWKLNLATPQQILRILPTSTGKMISSGLANRMHDDENVPPEDKKVLATYLHKLLTAPVAGEVAMNSILHTDFPANRFFKIDPNGLTLEQPQRPSLTSSSSTLTNSESPSETQDINEISQIDQENAEKEFQYFVSTVYDYKSHPRVRQMLQQQHQQRLMLEEQQDEQRRELESAVSGHKTPKGDSLGPPVPKSSLFKKFYKPQVDEVLLSDRDVRQPSVFARAPLQLSNILPKIHIPVTLLYGDNDWLYQGDVPFIVRQIAQKHRDIRQQTEQHIENDDVLQTQMKPTTSSFFAPATNKTIQLPHELFTGPVIIEDIDQDDVSNPNAPYHVNTAPHKVVLHPDGVPTTVTSTAEFKKAQSMLNLNPSIALDIVENAGHHLYGNNTEDFNKKVQFVIERTIKSSAFLRNFKEFKKEYDPTYSKSLLHKYYTQLQYKKAQKEAEQELRRQQCNISKRFFGAGSCKTTPQQQSQHQKSDEQFPTRADQQNGANESRQIDITITSPNGTQQQYQYHPSYLSTQQNVEQLINTFVQPVAAAVTQIATKENINKAVDVSRWTIHGLVDGVFSSIFGPISTPPPQPPQNMKPTQNPEFSTYRQQHAYQLSQLKPYPNPNIDLNQAQNANSTGIASNLVQRFMPEQPDQFVYYDENNQPVRLTPQEHHQLQLMRQLNEGGQPHQSGKYFEYSSDQLQYHKQVNAEQQNSNKVYAFNGDLSRQHKRE